MRRDVVTAALGNSFDGSKGNQVPGHAFRLVFLDCCHTADGPGWATAFGVVDHTLNASELIRHNGQDAQALLGWKGEGPGVGFAQEGSKLGYGSTLKVFFEAWMSGSTLKECISFATQDRPYGPQNVLLGYPITTRGIGANGPYSLRHYGTLGLKRSACQWVGEEMP